MAEVSLEDPTAFPVALTIDVSAAGIAKVACMARNGETAANSLDSDAIVFAPAGVLPLRCVDAVHFRTQEELARSASAREYANIRPTDTRSLVSPELFGGDGVELDEMRQFLVGLAPSEGATSEFFDNIDRLNGARAMLVSACPPDPAVMRAVSVLLSADAPKGGPLPPWLIAAIVSTPSKASGPDDHLYLAVCDVLRTEERSSAWRPAEVLTRIEQRVAEVKMARRDGAEIAKNLRPIRAILRNERDFKSFEPNSGLASAKALLLVLLRPDPIRLMAWDRKETGADTDVMLAAAVLVGLLRGHKKLPLEMRTAALDDLLAVRASATSALLPDALSPLSSGAVVVKEEADEDGGAVLRLEWHDGVVTEKRRSPPSAKDRLLGADLSRSPAEAIAINICRRLGWSDCVKTIVTSQPPSEFVLDTQAQAVRLTLPGVADVVYELDEAEFRRHVLSDALPAEVESEIATQIRP